MYSYAVLDIWSVLGLHHVFCPYIAESKTLMAFNELPRKTRYIQWTTIFWGSGKLTLLIFIVFHWAEWHRAFLFLLFFCSKQAVIMFWIRRQGETNVESVVVIILPVRHLQVLSTVLIMVCWFCLFLILMHTSLCLRNYSLHLRKHNFSVCSLGPLSTKNIFNFQSHSLSRMQRQTLWHTNPFKWKKSQSPQRSQPKLKEIMIVKVL